MISLQQTGGCADTEGLELLTPEYKWRQQRGKAAAGQAVEMGDSSDKWRCTNGYYKRECVWVGRQVGLKSTVLLGVSSTCLVVWGESEKRSTLLVSQRCLDTGGECRDPTGTPGRGVKLGKNGQCDSEPRSRF